MGFFKLNEFGSCHLDGEGSGVGVVSRKGEDGGWAQGHLNIGNQTKAGSRLYQLLSYVHHNR